MYNDPEHAQRIWDAEGSQPFFRSSRRTPEQERENARMMGLVFEQMDREFQTMERLRRL